MLKKKGKKYGYPLDERGRGPLRGGSHAVPPAQLAQAGRAGRPRDAGPAGARLRRALETASAADAEDEAGDLFGEMVKLKQKDHLFSFRGGRRRGRSAAAAGGEEASADFFLPAKTPVGDYTVDVFGFHKGRRQAGRQHATVHLERAPPCRSITSLAADHGLLYGCLAVALAVCAGLAHRVHLPQVRRPNG